MIVNDEGCSCLVGVKAFPYISYHFHKLPVCTVFSLTCISRFGPRVGILLGNKRVVS